MPTEYLLVIIPFILLNTVVLTTYLSKMGARITHLEQEMLSCKESDLIHTSKFDTLHKIEAQLELLIPHLLPQK